MDGTGLGERLCAGAPNHDQSAARVDGGEPLDVFHHLLSKVHQVGPGLDVVGPLEPAYPSRVEDGRHRLYCLERWSGCLEVLRAEYSGAPRRLIAVVAVRIPDAEDEVVEAGEIERIGDPAKILTVLGLQVPELGERPNRHHPSVTDRVHTGDERGGDSAQPRGEDAERTPERCRVGHGASWKDGWVRAR